MSCKDRVHGIRTRLTLSGKNTVNVAKRQRCAKRKRRAYTAVNLKLNQSNKCQCSADCDQEQRQRRGAKRKRDANLQFTTIFANKRQPLLPFTPLLFGPIEPISSFFTASKVESNWVAEKEAKVASIGGQKDRQRRLNEAIKLTAIKLGLHVL